MKNDRTKSAEKEKAETIATILKALHFVLIQGRKREHEQTTGASLHPFAWFQLLSQSPEYQWMRPLLQLMSDIDALLDQDDVTEKDLAVCRYSLESLFDMDESPEGFKQRYLDAMTTDSELIMAHAALKKAMLSFPMPETDLKFAAQVPSIRASWHKRPPRNKH